MTEFRDKWVKALRSGEYKQETGMLGSQEEGGFCCLGVACHLAVKEGIIDSYDSGNGDLTQYDEVIKALGLLTPSGQYGSTESLTYDNDIRFSFKGIADIIESEPRGLFV